MQVDFKEAVVDHYPNLNVINIPDRNYYQHFVIKNRHPEYDSEIDFQISDTYHVKMSINLRNAYDLNTSQIKRLTPEMWQQIINQNTRKPFKFTKSRTIEFECDYNPETDIITFYDFLTDVNGIINLSDVLYGIAEFLRYPDNQINE